MLLTPGKIILLKWNSESNNVTEKIAVATAAIMVLMLLDKVTTPIYKYDYGP